MATVKFEYGTWDNFWGYQCKQCYAICPYVQSAIAHENAIDENGGLCPVKERLDREREDKKHGTNIGD